MNAPLLRVERKVVPERNDIPLPPEVLRALGAIASDLRHLPTDCIYDRAELIHWLNRMARRVEAVEVMHPETKHGGGDLRNGRQSGERFSASPSKATGRSECQVQRDAVRSHANGSALAEAVFGKGAPVPMPPKPRTITSRKGKSVRVETRRSRPAGQLELGI